MAVSSKQCNRRTTRTNGSKVAHEQGLLPVLHAAWHGPVCHEYGGDASEDDDHEAQSKEPAQGDTSCIRHVEISPGEDCADVHEAAEIEKDIERAVDFVMAFVCLLEILATPVKSVASHEACEEVVGTDCTANTNGEEL